MMGGLFADISPWRLMALPFVECLVLVGIHSYLGLHVIRRQVIFVDLSLAQIAALGTTVGFLLGIHPHGIGAFLFSLSFTFLGAAIFAITRTRKARVPQEAIIGLVYAMAAAVMILVIDRAPHGAEHIKEVLTGSILWVKGSEVLAATVAYAVIGLFHFVFRKRFLAITDDPEGARDAGVNVVLWDLVFYMTFGFVITFSVNTAGVLLVFVFLVVPAVIGAAITDNFRNQLLIGWSMGTLVSGMGLFASYKLDLPAGPAVVSFYGVVLVFVALTLYVIRSESRARALGHVGLGIVSLFVVVGYFHGLRAVINAVPGWSRDSNHRHQATAPDQARKKTAVGRLDDLDLEAKEKAVKKIKDTAKLKRFFAKAQTPGAKLNLAERVAQLDRREGAKLLVMVLASEAPIFFRNTALERLAKMCKRPFTVDLMEDDEPKIQKVLTEVKTCVQTLVAAPAPAPTTGRR
jgi:zinc/manganese transport system permease protein